MTFVKDDTTPGDGEQPILPGDWRRGFVTAGQVLA